MPHSRARDIITRNGNVAMPMTAAINQSFKNPGKSISTGCVYLFAVYEKIGQLCGLALAFTTSTADTGTDRI